MKAFRGVLLAAVIHNVLDCFHLQILPPWSFRNLLLEAVGVALILGKTI